MALMKYGFGLFITREKKRKRKEESKNSYFLPFSSFFSVFFILLFNFARACFPYSVISGTSFSLFSSSFVWVKT